MLVSASRRDRANLFMMYSTVGRIGYLDRLELYKEEKPYEVSLVPVNVTHCEARRSNLRFTAHPFSLRDFSGQRRQEFSIDTQGFELETFSASLSRHELHDLDVIQTRYYEEARIFLTRRFGACKVFIFDATVSYAICCAGNEPKTLIGSRSGRRKRETRRQKQS